MDFEIPKGEIFPESLKQLFDRVVQIDRANGGSMELTALLAIMDFPNDVGDRMRRARGKVVARKNGAELRVVNDGKQIEEALPGLSIVSLIIAPKLTCSLKVDTSVETLWIKEIEGLTVNIPGPVNPDLDAVKITLPNIVVLTA